MHGKDEQAIRVLTRVADEGYANKEYTEIKKAVLTEKKVSIATQAKELFTKKMKLILIIGFGLGILQQFSGINAILYYAPMVFVDVLLDPCEQPGLLVGFVFGGIEDGLLVAKFGVSAVEVERDRPLFRVQSAGSCDSVGELDPQVDFEVDTCRSGFELT